MRWGRHCTYTKQCDICYQWQHYGNSTHNHAWNNRKLLAKSHGTNSFNFLKSTTAIPHLLILLSGISNGCYIIAMISSVIAGVYYV